MRLCLYLSPVLQLDRDFFFSNSFCLNAYGSRWYVAFLSCPETCFLYLRSLVVDWTSHSKSFLHLFSDVKHSALSSFSCEHQGQRNYGASCHHSHFWVIKRFGSVVFRYAFLWEQVWTCCQRNWAGCQEKQLGSFPASFFFYVLFS